MERLYDLNSGGNDQNALALYFFLLGYHSAELYIPVAKGGKYPTKTLQELRAAILRIREYSSLGTPAHLVADNISLYFERVTQSAGSTSPIRISSAGTMYAAVRAAANRTDEVDPARKWIIPGLLTADCDSVIKESGQLKRKDTSILHDNLIALIGQKRTSRIIVEITNPATKIKPLVSISEWLKANAQSLWEPSVKRGIKPKFNGKPITGTEYDVLATLRRHAYADEMHHGLTSEELAKHSGHPFASHALKMLRAYAETKGFINVKGPPLFVREAPLPPVVA